MGFFENINNFIENNGTLVYFGLFIMIFIAYILLITYSAQLTKNNTLIIVSYALMFLPMLALGVKFGHNFGHSFIKYRASKKTTGVSGFYGGDISPYYD